MARVQLGVSLVAFGIVFLIWVGVVAGLFLGVWSWDRFEGAIVAGGIGLLSVVFGAVGAYSMNKFSGRGNRWRE